jgi:hypothetical protein
MSRHYLHHRIQASPRAWRSLGEALTRQRPALAAEDGALYGIWRSQIGRPRDELNVITHWPQARTGEQVLAGLLSGTPDVAGIEYWAMMPTVRPSSDAPPTRQGNYAFRHFRTPPQHWDEFLELCAQAWPGFEASYQDSQIIGLWRYDDDADGLIDSVMLTRRPDLAAWERSKLPQGERESEVRRTLSRRYDLCAATYVHTTTLLTASDRADDARWA